MENPPPNDADAARPERYRPTYHRASSQRSAALARDILTRLKSIEDPDLEATNEREPEPTTTAPFSKRACAKRLRSFATSRRLPTDEGALEVRSFELGVSVPPADADRAKEDLPFVFPAAAAGQCQREFIGVNSLDRDDRGVMHY